MITGKENKSFSIEILFNYIFVASLITFFILDIYSENYKFGSSRWIGWIIASTVVIFSFVLLCKIIMFFYRFIRKIPPIRGNRKKYIILLSVITLINVAMIGIDYIDQLSKSRPTLNYIESYIMSNNKETNEMKEKVNAYIVYYKKYDKFKNELISFATQQADLYASNKVTNKEVLKDKLSSLLMMLNIEYPDIKEINYAYDKINDYSLDEVNARIQPEGSSDSEESEEQNSQTSNDTSDFLNFLSAIFPILLVLSPFIIFNIIVANLISRDARKRNMNTSNWWWATFVFGLFAILLYAIVRDPRQDI